MVFPMGICFAYPTKLDLEIESRSFEALCGKQSNHLGPLLMLSVDHKFNKFKLINLFEGWMIPLSLGK